MQMLCVFWEVLTQSINAYYKNSWYRKCTRLQRKHMTRNTLQNVCNTSEIHNILRQRYMRCLRHFRVHEEHKNCRRLDNLQMGRYLRDTLKVKVKQSLHMSGQVLRVTVIWGSQICRQSTQKGKVVTALCTGRLIPPPTDYSWCLFVRSLCGRKDYVQFQGHSREQYPRLPGLKRSAWNICATACLDWAGFLAPSPGHLHFVVRQSNWCLS
jgi:hypothetical protein